MANRSIQAKVERSAKETRELYAYDYLKYEGVKVTSADLARMCEGVKVKRVNTNRVVAKSIWVGKQLITSRRVVSNVGYAWNARTFQKRSGTCERALWIGKPPRI
jgi:hypothetical protein